MHLRGSNIRNSRNSRNSRNTNGSNGSSDTGDSKKKQKGKASSLSSSSSSLSSSLSLSLSLSSTPPPGADVLDGLLADAEYEIHQDPYRGILSQQQSLQTQTSITTPWNACEWGTLTPPSDNVKDDLRENAKLVVRHVGHCACPSFTAWTRQQKKNNANANAKAKSNSNSNSKANSNFKKKKAANNTSTTTASCSVSSNESGTGTGTGTGSNRNGKQQQENGTKKRKWTDRMTLNKKPSLSLSTETETETKTETETETEPNLFTVGLRPLDKNYRCACDYNPLCLGTLGGVVNQVVEERSKAAQVRSATTTTTTTTTSAFSVDDDNDNDNDDDDDDDDKLEEIAPPHGSSPSKHNKQKNSNKLARKGDEENGIVVQSPSPEGKNAHEVIDLEVDETRTRTTTTSTTTSTKTAAIIKKGEKENGGVDVFAFLGDAAESSNNKNENENKNENVIQSKPLETTLELPEEGNPADAFTVQDQNDQDLSYIQYSDFTSDELKRLRGSLDVDVSKIRSYVYRTLGIQHTTTNKNGNDNDNDNDDDNDSDNNSLTLDQYMKSLQQWHRSLIFVNPTEAEHQVPSDQMTLSIPPGIQNLGATCYLNTQLQCLAQNPAFLEGIFSWRLVNSSHNMNSVMTKLQLLLAQMLMGGDCKLTTLDFSNALGLEHNEQQDPNEFARLLFERMNESFQQCDDDGDLANLLQRIFHGVTTYETICMTCGNSSERSEGFMDLNLPIVKRPSEKATTIKKAFAKNADTDVQYCLDQYTCAEVLEGDNQYFCSTCACKRDATRVLKLTELPPVLNVQLSRYVFDRTKFVKKKLMDKVLLPTTLNVERSGGSTKKYLLCAVMRHQGTTAYSGHYVAETMDWSTGQWFEFNDDTVKLLPEGPSCSFDPHADDKKDKEGAAFSEQSAKKTFPSGSQDAYNMYYVDEDYLSRNAANAVVRRGKLCLANNKSDNNKQAKDDVLDEVAKKKEGKYTILSELCFTDGRISDRLRRRKIGIRKFMFPNAGSLVRNKPPSIQNRDDGSDVWVETDFLEKYLLCNPNLDDQLKLSGPVLRHQHLLCTHNMLHPRIARKGKLLPRRIYDAYAQLLEGERVLICQESESIIGEGKINDCLITPTKNLICEQCSQSYRDNLAKKLEVVRNVKHLYDTFDSMPDDAAFFEEGEEPTTHEEEYAYAVSRQTVTKYRKTVMALMKSLAKFHDGAAIVEEGTLSKNLPIFEGLDALDVSSFEFNSIADMGEAQHQLDETSIGNDANKLDHLFNSNLTCSHGRSNALNNGRVARFVSWQVWLMVKKVFPDAVELKKKRYSKDASKDSSNGEEHNCAVCQAEKASIDNLRADLKNWAKETREDFELKGLLDTKRTITRESVVQNFTNAKSGCRLVHRSDIQTWRKSVSTLISVEKVKGCNPAQLKNTVENMAFPNYHTVVLEFERQPIERLVTSLKSLICREHKLVIKSAIFRDYQISKATEDDSHQLSNCIAVLSDEEYCSYIASLSELLQILHPSNENDGSLCSPVLIDQGKTFLLQDVRNITNSYHPAINRRSDERNSSPDDILRFNLDGSSKEFVLSPGVCDCETCRKEFAPLLLPPSPGDDDKVESISVESFDVEPEPVNKRPRLGSAAADPILVESDLEDIMPPPPQTFPLRSFEVKENTSIDDALDSLKSVSALSNETDSNDSSSFLRRSTRKRASRYPAGNLLSENSVHIGLHHNMAALRLRLYEKCEVALSGRKLVLVLASGNCGPNKTLEINFEWGQRRLEELVDEMRGDSEPKSEAIVEPSKQLLLLYQRNDDGDSKALHETVMDSLLQIANFEDPESKDQSSTQNKRKRDRRSERGFRGTLLQSSSVSASTQNGDDAKAKAISAASAVSDEEKSAVQPIEEEPTQEQHTIMNESSDDEVLQSPRTKMRQAGVHVAYESAPSAPKIVLETSSEDESQRDRSTQTPISKTSEDMTPSRPSGMDHKVAILDSPMELMRCNIFNALVLIVDQPANESNLQTAIAWAIEANPTETNESALVDTSFAKYLSLDD